MAGDDNSKKGLDSESFSSPYYLHHSDSPEASLVSMVLNGNNFASWSRAMKTTLSAKNKLSFVDGCVKKPADDHPNLAIWSHCNDMVLSWLINSLNKEIAESVIYATNVADVWKDLHERFSQSNAPRIFQLKRELALCTKGTAPLSTYYTKLKTIWEELTSLQPLPICSCGAAKVLQFTQDCEQLIQFLLGLLDSFNAIRGQVLLMDPLPSINLAYSLILQEERQRSIAVDVAPAIPEAAALAMAPPTAPIVAATLVRGHQPPLLLTPRESFHQKSEKRNGRPTCGHCNKVGHIREKCYLLNGFPPGHHLHKPSYHAGTSSSEERLRSAQSLTQEQFQHLLAILQDGKV